ncbi:MAG: glycosyltransferase [Nitrospinae bacterium]|nr:glycosyltransferase [Nitrospinota bacterium]
MKIFQWQDKLFNGAKRLKYFFRDRKLSENGPVNPISEKDLKKFFLSDEEQVRRVKNHIERVGKKPVNKKKPRVFVAVHHVNWEKHGLVDGWAEVADIIHYDWGGSFDQDAPTWHEKDKPLFNAELLRRVEQACREKPIDIFFSYLSGNWVYPDTIRAIGKLGPITINISFDDQVKFWGYRRGSGLSGNAVIGPEFDICITSASILDVSKYIAVGANPLFLPPAVNPSAFSSPQLSRDISISFVGQCYGIRPKIVEYLRMQGIPVQTFGMGWPGGELPLSELKNIYARSIINIGFGYIGGSSKLVGLKGRDFEVPVTGGLYLTTYNSDLEGYFIIGKEIDCYRNKNELARKLKFYLNNPDLALKIGEAGRQRCLCDHTWKNRFESILKIAGFLQDFKSHER